MLSENITCEASVLNLLTPSTIELANIVVNEINEDESGIFVQITNQNNLHAALALPNSPVPQSVEANASLKAFRDWLINEAQKVSAASQVPHKSDVSLAFHPSTLGDAINITYGCWQQSEWVCHLRANRRGPEANRIGEFGILFWMEGTGSCRATLTIAPTIFG